MSDEGDVYHMIPDKSKTIVKEILGVSPERLSFLTDKGVLNVNIDRNVRCVGERDIQTLEYRFYDENNTEIGNTIESLSSVYYDSDYPISLGHYTTYNLVKADSVKIQIIKDDKVLDEFSSKIDQNKIRW